MGVIALSNNAVLDCIVRILNGGGAFTFMIRSRDAVSASLSFTVTVIGKRPASIGVPEITPLSTPILIGSSAMEFPPGCGPLGNLPDKE